MKTDWDLLINCPKSQRDEFVRLEISPGYWDLTECSVLGDGACGCQVCRAPKTVSE